MTSDIGGKISGPEFLIMDYGATLHFKSIIFVLMNKESFSYAEKYMVNFMDGTKITLLDYEDNEIFVASERLTVKTKIDTIADQTYRIGLGGEIGRKVKFQTDEISPAGRCILVVESWAEVEEETDYGW